MLSTQRLTLELVRKKDLKDVHSLLSLPEVDEYNTLGILSTIKQTSSVLKNLAKEHKKRPIERYTFGIRHKTEGYFVGLIGLSKGSAKSNSAETWYKLLPVYWKQGFATEALHEIINFGFNRLNLHRIEAGCAEENKGSIRVLEKVGMTLEGKRRKALPLKSGWSDTREFAILSEEWQ